MIDAPETAAAPRELSYGRQSIDEDDIRAVVEVLRSDRLTQGPVVERFERALADTCGAEHAVAVSSGTAALHLAALAAGIRPGDLAVTTPNTFLATANCVRYAGGDPVFLDIDPRTLNLAPDELGRFLEEDADAEHVRAVLPVHFAGLPADMERIAALARRRGMAVIEDASHALGASWRDRSGQWHRVGSCSHADMAVFSFHPVKQVTTAEGGAVLTNDDGLARRLRELRSHGVVREPERMTRDDGPWYHEMHALGFNYRISDVQCALGLSQLAHLDDWVERRREIVERYRAGLRGIPDVRFVREDDRVRPAWHLFTVQVPDRKRVYLELRERGIHTQVHYIPVHLQPYYRDLLGTAEGDCPHAEAYYRHALSLPLYPALADDDVDRVIAELLDVL